MACTQIFWYVCCELDLGDVTLSKQAKQETLTPSRAPGLTSGLQGSVNVHRGALLLVPQ